MACIPLCPAAAQPPKALEQLLSQSRCKASPNWICIAICMLSANRTLVNRLQGHFFIVASPLFGTVRLSQALFDLHLLVRAADALAAKSSHPPHYEFFLLTPLNVIPIIPKNTLFHATKGKLVEYYRADS